MPQPGKPAPRGEDWLVREVQDLKQKLQQLSAANPFRVMGIRPKKDGTEFDGFVQVNGTIDVSGDAAFTGNVKIGGTLELPNGIIGNDALASPILIEAGAASATGIAITTTPAVVKAITFVVPAGFTRAIVSSTAAIMAVNPNASLDYIYVQSVIMGLNGGEIYDDADAGRTASATIPHYRDFYGLIGGDEVTVGVSVRTGISDWVENAANQASIYAQVTFLR